MVQRNESFDEKCRRDLEERFPPPGGDFPFDGAPDGYPAFESRFSDSGLAPRERNGRLRGSFRKEDREKLREITRSTVGRKMIALYDYNPTESSPNVDAEIELCFQAGDGITVYGDMDEDGFYLGELHGRTGLVPSNFLSLPEQQPPSQQQQQATKDPPLGVHGAGRKENGGMVAAKDSSKDSGKETATDSDLRPLTPEEEIIIEEPPPPPAAPKKRVSAPARQQTLPSTSGATDSGGELAEPSGDEGGAGEPSGASQPPVESSTEDQEEASAPPARTKKDGVAFQDVPEVSDGGGGGTPKRKPAAGAKAGAKAGAGAAKPGAKPGGAKAAGAKAGAAKPGAKAGGSKPSGAGGKAASVARKISMPAKVLQGKQIEGDAGKFSKVLKKIVD